MKAPRPTDTEIQLMLKVEMLEKKILSISRTQTNILEILTKLTKL